MPDLLTPSPDVAAMPAPVLAAPPTDVQALLRALGMGDTTPAYFDAQRSAALQQAQQQWPALWRMAFAGP